MKNYRIEICANSVESAIRAQEGGASRVELCAALPEGGTTPSWGQITVVRERLSIPLHIIIRPRGGDFLYTPQEQEIMYHDIRLAAQSGADGIVTGCLTPEGDIDIPAMKKLIEAAGNLSVTFHRAFDLCRDPFCALEDIIGLGCDRLLTSGQAGTAEKGIPLLKKLQQQARDRIIVMPGCGIGPANILRIAQETGTHEFHLSGRQVVESKMIYRRPGISMGGTVRIDEYRHEITGADRVKAAVKALQNAG